MQRRRQGSNVATVQDQARARQQHRRQLRQRLSELLALADQLYRSGDFDGFEDCKGAIRLVISDLGKTAGGRSDKHLAGLPASKGR